MSAQDNRDRKAEVIARYALRLGWTPEDFRVIVGSFPYAERGSDRTMAGFARAAYRAAGVNYNPPHGRNSPTWKITMQIMGAAQPVVPDLIHEAPRWRPDGPDGGGLAVSTIDPLAGRVGRDKGPRGWAVVAALPPVLGATCPCGEPAVVRTPTLRHGHDRWRCPDCPPQRGEWGAIPRHPSPVNQGVDWSTTPERCRCFTTVCLCGRRPPSQEGQS